jgi:hypothetical protein
MILKWILKEIGCNGMDWIGLTQERYAISGSVKGTEFVY